MVGLGCGIDGRFSGFDDLRRRGRRHGSVLCGARGEWGWGGLVRACRCPLRGGMRMRMALGVKKQVFFRRENYGLRERIYCLLARTLGFTLAFTSPYHTQWQARDPSVDLQPSNFFFGEASRTMQSRIKCTYC